MSWFGAPELNLHPCCQIGLSCPQIESDILVPRSDGDPGQEDDEEEDFREFLRWSARKKRRDERGRRREDTGFILFVLLVMLFGLLVTLPYKLLNPPAKGKMTFGKRACTLLKKKQRRLQSRTSSMGARAKASLTRRWTSSEVNPTKDCRGVVDVDPDENLRVQRCAPIGHG